jgi:hypothetical protein
MIKTMLIGCFVFLCFGNVRLSAQCFDSTHVQYGAYCDPAWVPVCACNGITYRNDCFARNAGVVNNNWVYGICDAVDFVFDPNPAIDIINVHAILKNPGDMYVQVLDRFGRIYYTNIFPNVSDIIFQLSVNGYPTGIYFINIYCADGYRVKKVVVPDVQ